MESSFTVMRVRGIPIGAHWSWLLVFGLVVWSLAAALFPATYPGLSDTAYLVMAVVAAVVFFASVLAHELAHALRALREGIRLHGITLWLLGGVAHLRTTPASPGAEFRVAIAGPLVTAVLTVAFGALNLLGDRAGWPGAVQGVVDYLARINLVVLGFNLVPALPLDGGRVLRAWLWHRQRSFTRATASAAAAGRAFGIALVTIGLLGFFTGTGLGGLWFVFLGWFLVQAAQAEAMAAQIRRVLRGVPVRDVMRTDPMVVPQDRTVAEFLDHAAGNRRFSSYPVVDRMGGQALAGMVSVRAAATVPAGERARRDVHDIMTPADEVPTVGPDDEVADTLQLLRGGQHARAVVTDHGRVVGILSATDIAHTLEVEQARGLAPEPGSRRAGLLVWALVGLVILVAVGLLYRPPLLVIAPGDTFAVGPDVTINGAPVTPLNGTYLAATVTLERQTALGTLLSAVRPDREVVRASAVLPAGVPPQEYFRQQHALYEQSRRLAAAAAAQAAGLPVEVSGDGVRVRQIASGSPASGKLRPGDVIVAVDGQPVDTVQQLQELVRSRMVGSRFHLGVERGGERMLVEVTSARLPDLAETVGLGLLVETRNLRVDLPFRIQFPERQDVGGPSAGLVHALAIADLLSAEDYADGQTVAATGTIGVDGTVGPVGGVTEKAVAAQDDGAEVFLVPAEEVEQAREAGLSGLDVQGVRDLERALRLLDSRPDAA